MARPSLSAAAKAKAEKQAAKARAVAKRSRKTTRKAAAPPPPEAAAGPPKPSNLWWAVPIALLVFIVLAPLGIGARDLVPEPPRRAPVGAQHLGLRLFEEPLPARDQAL